MDVATELAAAIRILRAVATAVDEHDLDALMSQFADDAVSEAPRGTETWGTRFVGREAAREAFASRVAA
jgi:ketosteroid isomerase-like protein